MRSNWDWFLFSSILAVGAISLLVIYSVDKNLAASQFIFWIIGLAILYFFSQTNFHFWQKFSFVFYLLAILSLIILVVVAEPVRGSTRWISLGVFRFQPSEIAKVASIIALATFYKNKSAESLKNFFFSSLIVMPLIILVLIQPDIGNAIIFISIWIGVSLVSGLRIKHLITFAILVVILATSSFEILAPYQKERLVSFISPGKDPLGSDYHIIQSKIAIGSGQFFGRGLGRGSQSQLRFLPEAESDFIFASISEQLGFLIAGLVIIIYANIILKIVSIAKDTDKFGQFLIAGSASFLLAQFFINVGMNMGIVPATGITLPLISYGGSSLLSTLLLLGIIFSIRRNSNFH